MKHINKPKDTTALYLRAPYDLDLMVEEMARKELRKKVAVLTLALEQYAERHHPDLFKRFKGVAA